MKAECDLDRVRGAFLRRDWPGLADAVTQVVPGLSAALLGVGDIDRYVCGLIALARGVPAREAGASEVIGHAISGLHGDDLRPRGIEVLNQLMLAHPGAWEVPLLLGSLYEQSGARFESLSNWNRAIYLAHVSGECLDEATTPFGLVHLVGYAVDQIRRHRDYFLHELISRLEATQPASSGDLDRIRDATDFYLKKKRPSFTSMHHRPRFFFIPDLVAEPWIDPCLFAWRASLEREFQAIKSEALRVLHSDEGLEDFVPHSPESSAHLAGQAVQPKWEAFFFYRHGVKFEENHARCPRTSETLEKLDLCRIDAHAPEICFSVLRPETHILPHCGVTNARNVVHLPLIVPEHCALRITGAGERSWTPGQILAFDDTFEHEAWNNSSSDRVILLMDSWNPHLTAIERLAVSQIITTIARWHV